MSGGLRDPDPVYRRNYRRGRRRGRRETPRASDPGYGQVYWRWRTDVDRERQRALARRLRREGYGSLPPMLRLRLRYARRRWLLMTDAVLALAALGGLAALAANL